MCSSDLLRLVKGSHIVVPRLYEGEHAFILQHSDRRVIFVIPYEGDYTLIGTTDVPYSGDPTVAGISADETAYLCAAVGRYFTRTLTATDVVWSFAGVRPLYDDGSADASEVTRDYVLEVDGADSRAPVLSVFGGKLTTYRKLAEQALERIAPFFPGLKPPWTARTPLPGGDMRGGFDAFAADAARTYTWLPTRDLMALARRHGTRLDMVLDDASSIADLGQPFGAGQIGRAHV